MQVRSILASFLLSFSCLINATTFYVDNSCGTNGDGTTTVCGTSGPWNSLANSEGCNGMSPGDILEIREGNGVYREDVWQPTTGCSGTSGNNIIIQNYANEDVVLDGTTEISGSTWTSRGSGVYECTSGTCGTTSKFPFTAWYDRGSGEEQLYLIQTNTTCDSTLAAGYMRYSSGNVCAHLSDGSSPADANYFRIPYIRNAIQLNNTGVDYLTFRKNPSGGSFTIEKFRDHGITMTTTDIGIHIDGLEIGWLMDRGVNIDLSSITAAGFKVLNNTIHHIGQEGIRFAYDNSADNVIDGNTIYAIQTEPLFERCTGSCLTGFTDNATAIRAAELTNTQITNNVISDFGGGLNCRSYGIDLENGCEDCLVDSNYIYDSYKSDCSTPNCPQAIIFQAAGAYSYDGTIVSNNRIHNVNICISTDPEPGAAGTVDVINNTCSEPSEYGFQEQDGNTGTWNFTNNIFTAETRTPTYLISNTNNSNMTATYNSFYCTGCGGDIIYWLGSTYDSSEVTDFDSNSDYGDPDISLTGGTPSLKLLSNSSIAYNAGTNTGCPAVDFEDDSRPQATTCDVGADEYLASGVIRSHGVLPGVRPGVRPGSRH